MGLLDLPSEVIESNVLKYLSWNCLLRFRRVCRATKEITDGYLQLHSNRDLAPEIEINPETGKSFAAFMAMGIPTTKLYLNNPLGYRFYQDSEDPGHCRRQFMAKYGPTIKHLRVTQITMWPNNKELEFLSSLVNISSFKACHFGWGPNENSSRKQDVRVFEYMGRRRIPNRTFPANFRNLESIQIGENRENKAINRMKITGEIFKHCQKLKRASLPFTWTDTLPERTLGTSTDGSLVGEFFYVGFYMETRPNDLYKEQGRLELCDFIQYHDDIGGWDEWRTRDLVEVHWFGSLNFLALLEIALETGLKLANVSPYWFCTKDARDGVLNGNQLGIPVVSLRGLHPTMMTMKMPNLEKIVIPHTSRCVGLLAEDEEKPEWPALKYLDVTVDHCFGHALNFTGVQDWDLDGQFITSYPPVCIEVLWRLLFKDVVRVNLAELELKFEEDGRWKENVDLALPTIEDIVGTCPNLKRIHLGNWPGKEIRPFFKLWEGLPRLEEVTLENCREVGTVSFLGEKKDGPVFFKLQNLKKLSLKGLDTMPKIVKIERFFVRNALYKRITDLLFSMVLAKMNLKELVLTSEKALEKVTKRGITALLEGPFAGTIEKFPFENWSMAGVSPKEFKELGMKFRSYQLL